MKKNIKAYAVMTNKGNLIEGIFIDANKKVHAAVGMYFIAPTKKDAKIILKDQIPPENWIVHPIIITVSDEIKIFP